METFKTGGKETMKKRRFAQLVLMITMLFCLTFGTVCAQAATTATTTTAKAAVKNGWKKEGGQYYYYVKGKKVKNTWKTVTVANKTTGKKMTYRYYFSNTGKAYKGGTFFGENYLLVKKIGGKYYGFNRYAQMVKGVYYSAYGQSRAGFYAFNTKTGVYDARTSSRIRKAFVREKSSAALRKVLGRPLRTRKTDGCYGDGQEYLLEYTRFWVNTYKDKKGKEIVLDVISK